MYNENNIEKYRLLFSNKITDRVDVTSHALGATPGESLISDGATLTCKEQLSYHIYSQSNSTNPYNTSTPLVTLNLPADRNVFLFGLLPVALTTDLDISYFSGYEKMKCPIDGAVCALKPVEWTDYYDGIEVNSGYPLLMQSKLRCQKAIDHRRNFLRLAFVSNGQEELNGIRSMAWWSEKAPYYGVDPNTDNILLKGYIKAMDGLAAYKGIRKVTKLGQALVVTAGNGGPAGPVIYVSVKLVYAVDGGVSSVHKLITGKNYSMVREYTQTTLAKEAYLKEYQKDHPIKAHVCRATGGVTEIMPPLSWLLKPGQEAVFCGSYSSKVGTGKTYSQIFEEQKHETDEALILYDMGKLGIDIVEGGKDFEKFINSGDPGEFAKAKKIIDLLNLMERDTNRLMIDSTEEYHEYRKLMKENELIIK
jgi:hypothetical protein